MASGSIAHDLEANHDTLRYGLDGVKGVIVGGHPVQSLRETVSKNIEEKKRMIADLTYGSAFNIRWDLDRHIFSRGLKPFTADCRPVKLFAKHMKVEDQGECEFAIRARYEKEQKEPVSYAQLARSIHELAVTSDQVSLDYESYRFVLAGTDK